MGLCQPSDTILIAASDGNGLHFRADYLRPMARSAMGNKVCPHPAALALPPFLKSMLLQLRPAGTGAGHTACQLLPLHWFTRLLTASTCRA